MFKNSFRDGVTHSVLIYDFLNGKYIQYYKGNIM